MYHTCAYSASIANGSTNVNLAALTDSVLRVGPSNGFVMQEPMALLLAEAAPNNGTGFRLFSPKLAQFGYEQVVPLQTAAKTANGLLIASWPYRPFTWRNQEEVVAYVDTGGTASAVEYLVMSISNSIDAIPAGEELTLQIKSTTTATAGAWTVVTYTFSTTLPEGRYAMLASELQSTTGIYHRWTFWGQFYRPGMPSTVAFSDQQFPGVRDYRMGTLGQFSNVTPPNLEVLCSAADSSFTGFVRCIKVA